MSESPLPALGVDLGGTKTEALVMAPDGRELWRRRVATPAGDYAATLQAIHRLVDEARALHGRCTIGFGTPGSLAEGGLMKNCNSTCLNGQPLQRDLQALLGQPVALANDANCLALSEATDGAGAGAGVVFAAIVGTGTGAGIAVHGRVLDGPNRLAGEWGHNPLPWADDGEAMPACWCGRHGCIEAQVSGPALAADHARRHGGTLTAFEIAARGDEPACHDSLRRHARRLAQALASVINLLDPEVIVLGGGISRMAHLYDEVPALWGEWVFSGGLPDRVRTRLRPAVHGDSSGVRGAAWLGRGAG